MSSVYTPTIAIFSSTNATPIAITTSVNHGLATGDLVAVESHLVNTNANGKWSATVTGVNTLTLDNSVGNGVGVATGTITAYPAGGITVPSDGDLRNAASVNSPIEVLGSKVAFLKAPRNVLFTFLANGNFIAPLGCIGVFLIGWGGGGSGAGGSTNGTTTDRWYPGGSGGGGAQRHEKYVSVTAGSTYAVVIGAGGAAPAASSNGNDGVNTTFDTTHIFAGAQKGFLGASYAVANQACWCVGGRSAINANSAFCTGTTFDTTTSNSVPFDFCTSPGTGGAALANANLADTSNPGCYSIQGYAGGAKGNSGAADSGSQRRGGGGGGGGAGAAGAGAAGGAGSSGSAGSAAAGSAGSDAAANTGAGGGGGGAGGSGAVAGGTGGIGGAGGSGKLIVVCIYDN